MIGLAGAGAFTLVFTILAKLGQTMVERMRPSPGTRSRVFSPGEDCRGDTTLTGIARRASVEIDSPLSNEPCLLYGIRGEVGDADIADADGGDFDLELPSGERVMISLEHAVLIAGASEGSSEAPREDGRGLEDFLQSRGIPPSESRTVLSEHLVRDGDEITVIGTVLGGTVTSLGYRGASGARVLAGEDARPLVVHASPVELGVSTRSRVAVRAGASRAARS